MKLINRMRQGRTGNAMVLAALILLALTSVGLVSVQYTNTGLMSAGNLVRATQAGSASDAAMVHTMRMLGDDGERWSQTLSRKRKNKIAGLGSFTDDTGEVQRASSEHSLSILKRSSGESGSRIMPVAEGGTPEARMQQDIAYDGEIYWIDEKQGMAGWQTDADWCFQLFDLRSRGGIPNGLEDTTTTLCPRDVGKPCFDNSDCTAPQSTCQNDRCSCISSGVVVETRGRVIVGPTSCKIR